MATKDHFRPSEIQRGGSTIHISNQRAAPGKGWNVFQQLPSGNKLLAHRDHKGHALKFALDACEPGAKDTFLLLPATEEEPCPPSSSSSSAAS